MPNLDVPAVEHTLEVAHWWPSVIIHCKCQPGKDPVLIVLHAFGQTGQCPLCKKKVTAIGVTMAEGKAIIDVAVTVESHIRLN